MALKFKNIFFRNDTNRFVVKFDYDRSIVTGIKDAFGYKEREYSAEKREWYIVVNPETVSKLLVFAKQYMFDVADSAKAVISEHEVVIQTYDKIELPDLSITIPLKDNMFPYQCKGVAYNLEHKHVLIGDDMGLGKSVQAIASVVGADLFPCLVICPSHLKYNWLDEWDKWTTKKAVIIDDNVKRMASQYFDSGFVKVGIVNYESLPKYFAAEMIRNPDSNKVKEVILNTFGERFNSIIIDEIHKNSNPQNQRYKVSTKLTEGKEMVLGLSGTPIKNKVSELMYIFKLIKCIDKLGGQKYFSGRYLKMQRGQFGMIETPSNLEELQHKMKSCCFYARKKHEVLTELPDKFRQVISVDITNRKEYDEAERDFKTYLQEQKRKTPEEIERSMRAEMLVMMMNLIQISARGKIETVKSFCDDVNESGEKIILFAHHREVFDTLKEHFPKYSMVRGGINSEEKNAQVTRFKTQDEVGGIMVALSGCEGLNLTEASKVAFTELPWTAEKTDQAEDRAHRIGQTDSVNVYYFLGKNTIDEKMYRICNQKRALANSVTGLTDKTIILSNDMMKDLFAEYMD